MKHLRWDYIIVGVVAGLVGLVAGYQRGWDACENSYGFTCITDCNITLDPNGIEFIGTEDANQLRDERDRALALAQMWRANSIIWKENYEAVTAPKKQAPDPNEPLSDPNIYANGITASADVRFATPEEVTDREYEDKWFWIPDEAIRRLCSSGRVCAVVGHQWGYDPGVAPGYVYRETCTLCGKQRQQSNSW